MKARIYPQSSNTYVIRDGHVYTSFNTGIIRIAYKRLPEDDNGGEDGGEETQGQTSHDLGRQHRDLDGQKQAGVHKGSSGSPSVECHSTSTSTRLFRLAA